MKKILIFMIGLLCLLLTCWSCKKKQVLWEDLPYYAMDAEFQSYFAPAREGSFWIYFDSSQHILDTVRIEQVTGISGVIDNEDPLEGYRYDGFEIVHSSTTGVKYTINVDVKRDGVGYKMKLNYFGQGYGGGIEKINGSYLNCNYIDSVVVQQKTYYDVLEITDGAAYSPVWFVKGIGIIYKQRRAYPYEKLELVDSYIVPNL